MRKVVDGDVAFSSAALAEADVEPTEVTSEDVVVAVGRGVAGRELLVGAYALDREVAAVWWYLPSDSSAARMRQLVAARGLESLIEVLVRAVHRT